MNASYEGLSTLFYDTKQLVFVGGKGGVGKSSTASAIAFHLSKRHPTLLISTDPAHSLSDSLQEKLHSEITSISLEGHQLFAKELDASKTFQGFKEKHEAEIRLLFDTSTHFDEEDIDEIMSLMLPGIDEVMGLKSIVDILQGGTYQKVVVDTAPTGHALRLLFMPQLLNTWIKTMATLRWKYRLIQKTFKGKYTADDADDLLMDLKRSVARMTAILTDASRCEFILVTIPNQMAMAETCKLHQQLTKKNIAVNTLIINNIAPKSTDPFYQEWHVNQQKIIQQTIEKFSTIHTIQMPLFASEVHGIHRIQQFEEVLFNQTS
ncbi:MAG: ArsA family ATPase [Bacteroidota bacterium]